MLDPSSEECQGVIWEQVRKIFTQDRFFRIAVKLPGEAEANSVIKQWEEHTWRVLGQFCKSTYYGRLSQKVLKFYGELQKAAAACTRTRVEFGPGRPPRCYVCHCYWKAGYELVVNSCAPGRHPHARPDLLHFFPFSCLGRWRQF